MTDRETPATDTRREQVQDSVDAQLARLVDFANREGLYDAADWIAQRRGEQEIARIRTEDR